MIWWRQITDLKSVSMSDHNVSDGPGSYRMLALTAVLWLNAHFTLPSSQDIANWATALAAITTFGIAIHNKFFKKDKK